MAEPTIKDTTKDAKNAKATERKPAAKDKIQLRLASGEFAEAEIDSVNKNGTVNLTATVAGKEVQITSSPRDDSGLLDDSWRFTPDA